jgi:RNA polymerase sigma-54 factor
MKASLQLRVSQHLALTPQLQQAIKLLQLSTLELNQEIDRYLLENPLLEREGDDGERDAAYAGTEGSSDYSSNDSSNSSSNEASNESGDFEGGNESTSDYDDRRDSNADSGPDSLSMSDEDDRWSNDSGSYTGSGNREGDDDEDGHDTQVAQTSLRDHLNWQLGLMPLSPRDNSLVNFLIEELDEDGYLGATLDELFDTLPEELEVDREELDIALHHLQHLEPTGVGARSPQECLALQLKVKPEDPLRNLALVIVQDHLNLLANRDYARIMKLTGSNEQSLKAAHALIVSLDPRPGSRFTPLEARYITPDVLVRKVKGQWISQVNPDAFPKLRINRMYADILTRQRRGESGLTGQLQEARWLIKNVQQRFETIQRVSQAIVERQRQFFEHGEVAMRPLVLREIADLLELHESTISRVTSQKYMATPRGIFELKYFFGSHVSTDTGGACSATAIRALIKQLIAAEDGKKPLSDSQISEILGRQGIVVARRTVAKYRESLSIPPVNLRKTL